MPANLDHLKIANSSGFPLQIALETQVKNSTGSHGWRVRYLEHSWTNRQDNQSGFIDLVLEDQHGSTLLVIECKRHQQAIWLFMNSEGTPNERVHAKAWQTHALASNNSFRALGWSDVTPEPKCPEVTFCAVRGQSPNDKTSMLERISGELVSATEALAQEERDFRPLNQEHIRFYFNVIVTTAELKLATFSPEKISLIDGMLDATDAQIADVPFVRFRKQLTTRTRELTWEHYANQTRVGYEKENTIFVVSAEKLLDFLEQFRLPDHAFRPTGK